MKLSLSLLAAAVCAAASVIHPVARAEHMSVNPSEGLLLSIKADLHLKREALPATNAERLARGLPIKTPRRHYKPSRRSDGPANPAPSSQPPTKYTRVIRARDVKTGDDLGYVHKDMNIYGEFGVDTDINKALHIEFSHAHDDTPFNIKTLNGPAKFSSFPYLGAIVGFSNADNDLGPESFHYAYLGNTEQTPADSPPASGANSFTVNTAIDKKIESAIWKYDEAKNELTAQWVNTDGHKPQTFLVYFPNDNVFTLTGDVAAFQDNFGPSPQVSFHLEAVPAPPA